MHSGQWTLFHEQRWLVHEALETLLQFEEGKVSSYPHLGLTVLSSKRFLGNRYSRINWKINRWIFPSLKDHQAMAILFLCLHLCLHEHIPHLPELAEIEYHDEIWS